MITTGVSNDQKAIKIFVVMQAFSIFQHQKIPFGGSKCSQFVRSKKNPYFLYMYIKLHAMRSGHNVLTIFGIYSSLQQSHTSLDFGIFGEVGKYSGRDGKIRTGSVYECCKTVLICRVRATSNTYPTVSIDKRRPDSYSDYHSCLMSPCMQAGPFLGKKLQC